MNGLKFVLVFSVAFACARVEAAYAYKVIVWSYNGDPSAAAFDTQHFGHTWATFIKAWVPDNAQNGPNLNPARPIDVPEVLEQYTMSWLPASLNMTPGPSRRGANYTLAQTIALARQGNHPLASSGPVTITPKFFEQAKSAILQARSPDQHGRWGTNAFLFRFLIKDCIHKVSDIVPTFPRLHTGTEHGESASIQALRWMVNHRWAIERPKDRIDYSIEASIFKRYGLSPAEVGEFDTNTKVAAPAVFPHTDKLLGSLLGH